MSVAQTILEQLGGRRFIVMTGAKNLMSHEKENALSMRLPGNLCKNRINYLKITLAPTDTYTLEFGRVRGTKYKVVDTIEDIYVENLREVFEDRTGLLTSLGTMGR